MSDIVAWECGSCEKTNEDMARCHCLICGEQRPVRYYIIVIESGAHDNFPHSAYGQKQKKEGRHQKIKTLTGERTRNR
jgi:hypothetical protein